MAANVPQKQYYVYRRGFPKGEVWDEEKFNRNKEAFFNDYKDDGMAVEISPYVGDDEVGDDDALVLQRPGYPKGEMWDGAKFKRNREALLKDYPDIILTRATNVDYWGDQLRDINDRYQVLQSEYESLPKDAEGIDLRNADDEALVASVKASQPTLRRKREITREINDLFKLREVNPVWQRTWKAIGEKLDTDMDRIGGVLDQLARDYAVKREHTKVPGVGAGQMDVFPNASEEERQASAEYETYAAAHAMLEDAKRAADAPSRYEDNTQKGLADFWQGVVENVGTAFTPAQLVRAGLNRHLVDAVKTIQEHEGKDANIYKLAATGSVDNLDYLNSAEKELLKAFAYKAQVESLRSDKVGSQTISQISRSYQAGQGAIASVGYMIDFFITHGAGEAAAKAVAGNLVKKAGRNALAKIGAESLYGTVKALAMAPLMPSSYSNFTNNLLQFNNAGAVDLSGKAMLKAAGDVIIEVISETIGSKPLELIGLPLKNVKFPDWAKALRNSPVAAAFKQFGYNGFFEEMVEEWTGNALRAMTGVDKDALKDFATIEQQLVTAGAFAPMFLFGAPVSLAQFSVASKNMRDSASKLEGIVGGLDIDEANKQSLLSSIKNIEFETPEEWAHQTAGLYQSLVENGADPASAYKAIMDYTKTAAKYKVMQGVFDEQKDIDRSARLAEMDAEMGNENWHHVGENGASFVRIISDANGNERFVYGSQDGTLALVDRQGGKSFISEDELAQRVQDGTLADSGEVFLFDYLDGMTEQKRKEEEQTRMAEEEQAAQTRLAQLIQPGMQVNIGTVENPNMGTIQQVVGGRIIVAASDGSIKDFTPQEIAPYLGVELNAKTDEQLQAEEEAEIEREQAEKKPVISAEPEAVEEPAAEGEEIVAENPVEVDDNIPRDFRGNPLPMRKNKQTGEMVVDGTALWNKDPEAWAVWNDANPNQKVTSRERLEYQVQELSKEIDKDTKAVRKAELKGIDADEMDKMEDSLSQKLARRDLLMSILAKHSLPVAANETLQSERRKVIAGKTIEKQEAGFPGIQQRWEAAPKVIGSADELRLANGETIQGHYVLTEANATTPSHNPADGFKMSEGFPADENGKTVNDRDYEHDKDAQKSVTDKAENYDQRALQTPVIVSPDGVVLSGNDRTMASQLAAQAGTDQAYVDYLAKYAQKYGFATEDLGSFEHPRVVFVPDNALPYDAATFAKFNAEDKKSQNKTEKAVKAGKTISAQALGQIAALINGYDDINALYNDAEGVEKLIGVMVADGIISPEQVSALRDGELLSGAGTDLLESVLLGSSMEEEAVRIAMADKTIRKPIVSAIAQIVTNNTLEGYSLRTELTDAVVLVAEGKRLGEIKNGDSVQNFIRQQHLFMDDVVASATVQLLADAINNKKTAFLKKVLSSYNRDAVAASEGQMSILTGDVLTRDQILRDILTNLGYDTNIIYDTSEREAEQRAAEAGSEPEENEGNSPVQSDAGGAVSDFDREQAAIHLEEGNVGELADYINDEEIVEFLRLWDAFQPSNDALGQAYTDLDADLHSSDKKVKKAAQAKIDALEAAQVEAFAPVEEFVQGLIEKYGLEDVVGYQGEAISAETEAEAEIEEEFSGEEELEEAEENEEELEEEPKPKKSSKKGGRANKPKEQPYVVKGGASEATIAKQTYTQDEWEEIVYGYSTFGVFESKKTGERIQLYLIDDAHPIYHDHRCIISRRLPGPNGKMSEGGIYTGPHTETQTTTDYLIKYLKANKFKPVLDDHHNKPYKNKHGYWVNAHGVVMNPIRIILPSVKKGWANFSDAKFYQDDSGKWYAGGSASYGTGGGTLSVNRGPYENKSGAIKAVIDALTKFRAEHPGNHTDLRDVDNLIRALKTKTLPQALLEEGALSGVFRPEITASEYDDGVQGDLFGTVEPEGTVVEAKPKPKRTAKKKAAKPVSEAKDTDEGEDEDDEPKFELEAEEGTPGNFHWISEGVCTNPQIIVPLAGNKVGPISKIALAEKDGKWYSATFFIADADGKTQIGSQIPTFKSSYVPYPTRDEAIKAAIKYLRFLLEKFESKGYGETFNNVKSLINGATESELGKNSTVAEFDEAEALENIDRALKTNNPARVANVLSAYRGSFDDDTNAEIDLMLIGLRENGVTKTSKERFMANAQALYDRLSGKEGDFIDEHVVVAGVPTPKKEEAAPAYGSQNKMVTTDQYEELKKRMKEKLGQVNAGFDPETFFIGAQMAVYHIEAGARLFIDFARRMIADLGDAVRPYLKAIYNGARDLPGMEELKKEMTPAAEVEAIDVDAIGLETETPTETPISTRQGWEQRMRNLEDGTEVQGFDFMSEYDILENCDEYIDELQRNGLNIAVVDMRVIGSRAYGMAREDSDLDVLVEYEGDMKEDEVFNALNEEPLRLLGIKVDFFPIRSQESGTMTEWLESHNNGRPVAKEQPADNVQPVVRQHTETIDAEPVQEETPLSPAEKWAKENYTETTNLPKADKEKAISIFNSIWNKSKDGQTLIHDGGVVESVADEFGVSREYEKFMRSNGPSIQFVDNDDVYELVFTANLVGGKSHLVVHRFSVTGTQEQTSGPSRDQVGTKSEQVETIGELGTYTHTKTGKEMSIVRLSGDRLSNDEFKRLKARAKEFGGYYSSFGGAKGFLFDNEEDAIKFNTINETQNVEDTTDEQTAADTSALVSKAASLAEQAETLAEADDEPDQRRVATAVTRIDNALDAVDDQLALLGYYEADTDGEFNESFGYSKSAEKKAVKDANRLAKKLAADLGLEVPRGNIAKANIAPAGGDITFRLPINDEAELYVCISLVHPYDRSEGYSDDLMIANDVSHLDVMFRVENPKASGFTRYLTQNAWAAQNSTYAELLRRIRFNAKSYLPEQKPAQEVAQNEAENTRKSGKKNVSSQESGDTLLGGLFDTISEAYEEEEEEVKPAARVTPKEINGFKIGDKVLYTPDQGSRKTIEATIYDFEGGRPVLDTGLAPVLYELVNWENVQPINKEGNGIQGNDAVRTEGLPADDSRPAGGETEGSEEVGEGEGQESGGTDEGGTGAGNVDTGSGRSLRRAPRLEGQNKRNYRPGKDANVPTSTQARYRANVEAIRLLKDLQDKGQQATKEQQAVLARFTGWGGLGGFFNNEYSSEYRELKTLLTEDELQAAVLSANTAYYTPTGVIDAMWTIAGKLGFEGGNILEGSAGIGNILAQMPKATSEHSSITAVELDNITGGILEQLYPDANVHIKGFQEVDIPNNSVDLAITNVPFGDIKMYDSKEKDLSRKFGSKIHDFCIAKNVRKLREGGIGIFISTRGTLDASNKALRQWIVNEAGADVIGAFRLNNATFEGTKVTSDIIVVRKRVNGKVAEGAIDVTDTVIAKRGSYRADEGRWDRQAREYVYETNPVALEINTYFNEHPENMGGKMGFGYEHDDTYRPGSSGLWPDEKINQSRKLSAWAKSFTAYDETPDYQEQPDEVEAESVQNVKEGQVVANSKGEICVSRGGKAIPLGVNANKIGGKYTKVQALNDYNALKQAINDTLAYELNNLSDEGLKPLIANLNKAYDTFVRRYGHLNRNVSISFLRNDVDFAATAAVEKFKETKDINGKVSISYKKADVFNGRVLGARRVPNPTDAREGVIVSINKFGRIDIPFIADALKKDQDKVREEILSSGLGFENPQTGAVEVEYEYLSGNVREKLEYAKEHNEEHKYDKNIEALEKVIPADIPSHLIEFSLGSDWIPTELYTLYAIDKLGLNEKFVPYNAGGEWHIPEREWEMGVNNEKNRSAGVTSEKLHIVRMGHELLLAAMNNSQIQFSKTFKDYDGTSHTETDKEATQAASTKMSEMRDDFKEWARAKMLDDNELAARIGSIYNNTFNANVPKKISDTFVPDHFEGQVLEMNGKPFTLYPHQASAAIRATTEPLMLAHEVGAGKTFTLITTAMEMRRLGTAKKPMIVVQNATLGQFVSSAKALYPNAKILTISEKDRTVEGRSAFYAKIKYNDWDIIIIPQSVFDRMPDSQERQRAFIQEKIEEKQFILSQAEEAGGKNSNVARQLKQEIEDLQYEYETGEKPKKGKKKDSKREAEALENAKVKTQKQLDRRTDAEIDFDEMGIDALLVDEAHAYKRLGFATKTGWGVKGIDTAASKTAAGLYLKTRSVFDKVGWRNVVFATGTPISNTAAEIWTFMKYLMPAEDMRRYHIYYFDDFVRNFGSIEQRLEFRTQGDFKEVSRFASYTNLPELVRIWSEVCDTVLAKDAAAAKTADGKEEKLEDKLPVLEKWTDDSGEEHVNQARDFYLPQSPSLIDIMTAVRAKLQWYENLSGKEKKENSSVPLTMFGIAKSAAIDPRLVDKNAADEPTSKTNKVVEEVVKALEDSKRYNGTCAIFSDRKERKDYVDGKRVVGFNLFEEIKRKLIEKGVPEDQIVIIKSGMNAQQKEKIFARVNAGEIRVIMGTTATLGTGVNIQERLFFEAHLDAPDRPMDYTQRTGRILRQGNLHKEWNIPVRLIRFGVEDSLDVTAYQRLATKSKFINSIMNAKPLLANGMENRVLEEEDEAGFDNPVAVLSGSQYALLKNAAERDLRKLRNKQEQHRQDQIYIERTLKTNENTISNNEKSIERNEGYLAKAKEVFPDGKPKEITIEGRKVKSMDQVSEVIKDKIIGPLRERIETLRNSYDFVTETQKYTIAIDGVPVQVNVKIDRFRDFDERSRSFKTQMRTTLTYSCPQFGVEDRFIQGGYQVIKDVVKDFSDEIATGRRFENAINRLKATNERLNSDNALMLERRGKPFADEAKLADQEALVKDYTEKMRAEMAEKEKKYAEAIKNSHSNFNLDEAADSVDDETGGEEEEHFSEANPSAPRLDLDDYLVFSQAVNAANKAADLLGLHAKIVVDNTSDKKGAYKEGTNYITINIAACESLDDVARTVFHEGVAHFGLRKLLAKQGSDMAQFVKDVFRGASLSVKGEIVSSAIKSGKSIAYATEEYIAELAEKMSDTGYVRKVTQPQLSFWHRVVEVLRNLISKVLGVTYIEEPQLRDMLISSFENLVNGASEKSVTSVQAAVDLISLKYKPISKVNPVEKLVIKNESGDYGYYDSESDSITIFAVPNWDYDEFEEAFFHENLHAFIHKHSGDGFTKPFVQAIEDNALISRQNWEDNKQLVYSSGEYAGMEDEELCCRAVAAMMRRGLYPIVEKYLEEDTRKAIVRFFNKIGYNEAVESGPRRKDAQRISRDSLAFAYGISLRDGSFEEAIQSGEGEIHYSRRTKPAPEKTGIGYKVFYSPNGVDLYPPMVANPGGESTPVGEWLDADEGEVVATTKTGRKKVKAGGKGTQGGGGTLAYRPGWHLGTIPYALQFNRGEKVDNPLGLKNKKGDVIKVGKYFPSDFVWAEVEYAADKDWQAEADATGINEAGNFEHSLVALPHIPTDGYYRYRTNPNPATDPWIITGAIKVNRVLSDEEVDELVRAAGREPQEREPEARNRVADISEERAIAQSLLDRYDNQDGSEEYPFISAGEDFFRLVEEELPNTMETEPLFALIDKYRRMDDEAFDEGYRDFTGGEMSDLFEDFLSALREYAEGNSVRNRPAFHGSRASFEAFDLSHLGEGEGVQAHGWGHYVSFLEQTAGHYANVENKAWDKKIRELNGRIDDVWSDIEAFEQGYYDERLAAEQKELQEAKELYTHKRVQLNKAWEELQSASLPYWRQITQGEKPAEAVYKELDADPNVVQLQRNYDILQEEFNELKQRLIRANEAYSAAKEQLKATMSSDEYNSLKDLRDRLLEIRRIYNLNVRPKNVDLEDLSLEALRAYRDASEFIAEDGFTAAFEGAVETIAENWATPEMLRTMNIIASSTNQDWEYTRNVYTVEIPDDNGSNYINEQQELSMAVRDKVIKALRDLPEDKWKDTGLDFIGEPSTANAYANRLKRRLLNGGELYGDLNRYLGGAKQASEFLHKAGFVGIKYDGRQDGPCAVIFDGRDIEIVNHSQFRHGEFAEDSPVNYNQSMGGKRLSANETARLCGVDIEFRPSSEMMFNGKPLAGRWVDGKMYICLEHCRDANDAVRTVLHEGVGHNGLRRLIGNENMREFCLEMLQKLPEAARNEIADNAVYRYGGNIAEAVEEYLAEKAELMDFENADYERNFWDVVRHAIRRILAKIGINVPLSERDVRWLLWQSYNANKQGDLLNEAKRQVVAKRLGFHLTQQADKGEAIQAERNKLAEDILAPAARIYNKDVVNWMARLHETWVDKDDSVGRLVSAIEKATNSKAKPFEDIRLSLNQQSSKGLAAIEKYEREQYNPMKEAVKTLMREKDCSLHDVERYVMIKHGLERNEVFAKRDARDYYKDIHDSNVAKISASSEIDDITRLELLAKEETKLQKHLDAIEAGTDVKYKELRHQDYGGLTAMFSEWDPIEPFREGIESEEEYQARCLQARHPKFMYIDKDGKPKVDMAVTEEAATEEVAAFEAGHEDSVAELWRRINSATKSTLKHQYDSNMLSRKQYLEVKDMFQYYVPLRGFADNTAENLYDYYRSDQRNNFAPPLLRAEGRKTEAESPFGYIGSMASSGIAADMKNETKLALYYFVSNRPKNDLVSISEVWYKNTGVDELGRRIFTPVYPPFKEDLSSEEAKKAYEEWEKGMEEEAKVGFAFKGSRKLDLHNSVIHIDKSQADAHIIKFKVGGRDMMMFINGNPRAAQAINNELNVEMSADYQRFFGKILRWFSGINTSYNPEFWMSNAQRDALFALMSVDIKEDSAYGRAFRRNFAKLLGGTLTPGNKKGVFTLKKKLDKGELGDSHIESLYREFVENGGVTGYTTLKNNEEWELEIRKYTSDEKKVMRAIKKAFDTVQAFGEAVEQMTRFAAYVTSREEGKQIKDAVNDAKELTVNFNRKGSGKSISFKEADRLRTKSGKKLNGMQKAFVVAASWLPVYGRRFIMFFNASTQGLNSVYRLAKKNGKRLAAWTAGYFVLGAIQALIHGLLDDDDDYLDIPDYERRNNLLFGADGVYFKWALPQEMRVWYGLGDMVVNHSLGREPHKTIAGEFLSMASDIAPLNPAGGISAVAPSALTPVVEVALNRDYKGARIFDDLRYLSDEERKRTPAYQRAFRGTGKVYILLSKFANWLSGGDYADAGWLNINPASVEHIVQGATGGAGTTISKFYRGTIGQIVGEDFMVRNTPFLSRLLTLTDERYRNAHTTELFDYYRAEADHTKHKAKAYLKEGDMDKLDALYESDEYEIMQIVDSYRGLLDWYNQEMKATDDKKERKQLMREQDAVRKEMILEISNIGKDD